MPDRIQSMDGGAKGPPANLLVVGRPLSHVASRNRQVNAFGSVPEGRLVLPKSIMAIRRPAVRGPGFTLSDQKNDDNDQQDQAKGATTDDDDTAQHWGKENMHRYFLAFWMPGNFFLKLPVFCSFSPARMRKLPD